MKIIQLLIAILIPNILFAQVVELDKTFGNNGHTITSFEAYSAEANSIELQSDGKILLAGFGEIDTDNDIVVVRYLPNGELDTSFALDGRFILNISDARDRCHGIAVDSKDNIFLTGYTVGEDFLFKAFVIKLNLNGVIDSTFAKNGVWISKLENSFEDFRAILLQADEKILITGKTEIIGEPAVSIVRLNADGTLDTEFGENGRANVAVPSTSNFNPKFAKLNTNEEIITGGFLLDGSTDIILVKFGSNGDIDPTFGNDGILIDDTNYNEYANSMAIQKDNKILVCSSVDNGQNRDFGLVRYNQDGLLDTDFGTNGRIFTDFFQITNSAHSISLQEDGKIILGGFVVSSPNANYAIARYDTIGNLDKSFGGNGKIVTDLGLSDYIFVTKIMPNNNLLCAGNSITADNISSFSIARYLLETTTNSLDIALANQLTVFPNPSNGNFVLSNKFERLNIKSIHVFNSVGQQIQTITNIQKDKNNYHLKLKDSITEGLFILKIEVDKNYFFEKILIKK